MELGRYGTYHLSQPSTVVYVGTRRQQVHTVGIYGTAHSFQLKLLHYPVLRKASQLSVFERNFYAISINLMLICGNRQRAKDPPPLVPALGADFSPRSRTTVFCRVRTRFFSSQTRMRQHPPMVLSFNHVPEVTGTYLAAESVPVPRNHKVPTQVPYRFFWQSFFIPHTYLFWSSVTLMELEKGEIFLIFEAQVPYLGYLCDYRKCCRIILEKARNWITRKSLTGIKAMGRPL